MTMQPETLDYASRKVNLDYTALLHKALMLMTAGAVFIALGLTALVAMEGVPQELFVMIVSCGVSAVILIGGLVLQYRQRPAGRIALRIGAGIMFAGLATFFAMNLVASVGARLSIQLITMLMGWASFALLPMALVIALLQRMPERRRLDLLLTLVALSGAGFALNEGVTGLQEWRWGTLSQRTVFALVFSAMIIPSILLLLATIGRTLLTINVRYLFLSLGGVGLIVTSVCRCLWFWYNQFSTTAEITSETLITVGICLYAGTLAAVSQHLRTYNVR